MGTGICLAIHGVLKTLKIAIRIFVGIGPFSVGRRLDVMLPRPSPMLSRRETAAMLPTFLGGLTSAWVVLAGEGLAVVFCLCGRKEASKARETIRNKEDRRNGSV
jgi:hypothetical protein